MIVEDPEALRGRMIKKEKLIKDVVSMDSRPGYQFISFVKKEYDKEKNVLVVKLALLYKLAQALAAGKPGSKCEDLVAMAKYLYLTVDRQVAHLDQQAALHHGKGGGPAVVDVKEAIREYMLAKDLMKKKITGFILKHRGGIIKTKAEADVAYMKKTGQIEKPDDPVVMDSIQKAKEDEILMDMAHPELLKKTSQMEDCVNRLVAWRARAAATPQGMPAWEILESEKTVLVKEFMQAVSEVKAQALEGVTGGGIFSSPEGLGIVNTLKTNLGEQKMRANHILEFFQKLTPELLAQPMHEIEGSSVAQAGCDKAEELTKAERNAYVDLRKWEPTPGQFFEEMSASAAAAFDEPGEKK